MISMIALALFPVCLVVAWREKKRPSSGPMLGALANIIAILSGGVLFLGDKDCLGTTGPIKSWVPYVWIMILVALLFIAAMISLVADLYRASKSKVVLSVGGIAIIIVLALIEPIQDTTVVVAFITDATVFCVGYAVAAAFRRQWGVVLHCAVCIGASAGLFFISVWLLPRIDAWQATVSRNIPLGTGP